MNLKVGDRVEFIYKNKKSVGVINGVYPGTQEVSIKQSDSPVDLLFSDKAVAKVEEQERIVVPQFVADWISHCKQREYDLACLLDYVNTDMHGEMNRWLILSTDNQETLARAWLDGYEVEKEPLYYVKFVDANNGNKCYLNVRSDGCKSLNNSVQNDIFKTQFTEGEIGEIDERYWQFAVPVEEEEE
ncbi:TPA_asm: DUF1642 domain-containing protein [Listeria monocytogenes]|uniref:DUF1642 domain-containing protein n=1 Tax=Listeria monocytogenes TaxID=1639 RepID=UPI0005447D55|nr:DUF1642 domain-containing protein [Listeria monocytogenes]EAG3505184.1 DUF1642 domain-containing protein [Listeria monocytogenes]EAG6421609.1 DUF1642 domain-containing protein [Listeria monocytogenes]KHK10257.1 hypothetical protein I793_11105 [Listeria monocytogenes SHL001]MCD1684212.1 DUF1642 domain-containing protein [Listeria monocytogenes]MDA5853617.1 DUF1642 domain-containing protein [Listeria monocytogenes]